MHQSRIDEESARGLTVSCEMDAGGFEADLASPGQPPDQRRLKLLVFTPKLTLGCAIFYWLVHTGRFDVGMYRGLMHPSTALFALGAFLAQSLAVTISLGRWWLLLRAQGIPMPFAESLRVSYKGTFMGLFLPGTLGTDGLRLIHLQRHYRGHLISGAASITLDRALGLVALITLAVSFGLFFLLSNRTGITLEIVLAMVLALAAVFLALAIACGFVPLRGIHLLRKNRHLDRFVEALFGYRKNHRILVVVVAVSIVSHLLIAVAACFGLAALDVQFSILSVAAVTPVLTVIRFLPLTPLGLGVADAAGEALYSLVGLAGGAENQMFLRATFVLFLLLCGLSFFSKSQRPR